MLKMFTAKGAIHYARHALRAWQRALRCIFR